MRILCDQNIPAKYVEALESTNDFTVSTVKDVLQHDATDSEIAAYAEQKQ
jgi:predicted nuclease of predicted toxin-antitoxin system